MINWQEHPRYQRALQKLQRMSPDQRAIINAAMLDERFGDAESRKMLQSLQAGATKKYSAKSLSLTARGQAQRYDIAKENIALSRQRLASQARSNQAMQKLSRKKFKFEKRQLPISTALGVAGVGSSGFLGYQDMKRKQKMAQGYLDI